MIMDPELYSLALPNLYPSPYLIKYHGLQAQKSLLITKHFPFQFTSNICAKHQHSHHLQKQPYSISD